MRRAGCLQSGHHDTFLYKGRLVRVDHDDEPFESTYDFGDAKANADYLAQYESGEVLNLAVVIEDENGEVIDSLCGIHLLAEDTRGQIRRMIDDGELRVV
jgi:hypothetical protein